MQLRTLFPILTFAALMFQGSPAQAQNVLLPADNGKSSSPNLGFMPTQSQSEEQSAPAPIEVKPSPPPVTPLPVQAPQPVISTPPAIQSTVTNGRPPPVHVPANSLTVALTMSTFWNTADILNVSSQLGIPQRMVMSECRIGFTGMLMTDHGSVAIDSNQAPATNVGYDGSVTNATINPYAACVSAPHLTPFSSMQKIGDKFSVVLSSAFCTPSAPFSGTKQQLVIMHGSSGNDTCLYR